VKSKHASTDIASQSKFGLTHFFTINQIADCLDVSPRTVRRWIETRLLVAHKINGLVRVSEDDFQIFLATHRDY
jgi:excisionase family DNA binding protein